MNRRWAGPGAGREGTGKRRVNTAATKARETYKQHSHHYSGSWASVGQNRERTHSGHQNAATSLPVWQDTTVQVCQNSRERVSSNRNTHIYSDHSLQKNQYAVFTQLHVIPNLYDFFFHGRFETWHKSYGPQIILLLCFWLFYSLTTQIPIYLLSIYHMENGQYIMQHFSCCGKMKEESHVGFKQYEVE